MMIMEAAYAALYNGRCQFVISGIEICDDDVSPNARVMLSIGEGVN
jgi:hypothetical protein